MCGIVGIVGPAERPVSEAELRAMNDQIVHRGPDDDGYWTGDGAGLAMRRLSIIDLAGGKQPITNEDGSIVVVFNGELYNFRELKECLEGRGHVFRTNTDTEVIPHLYEERGDAFVEDLNGMFGIALWDRKRGRLLLARDRLGIKPLYYAEHDGRLVFGSELKSLVAAGIDRRVSREALYHYLTYAYVPGAMSIYEGVHKLLPGHVAVYSGERLQTNRYWCITPAPDESRTEQELLDDLEALLTDSVRKRLMSDVPLGAFLSGGVDSSLIVALMSRCSSGPVRTFTISFDEAAHDETEHARAVAERFGTQHESFVVRPRVADHFERIVTQFDEPFADASAIPTYFVSEITRQHVTVALSGDGGDEVFGGYQRYLHYFKKRPLYRLPGGLRRGISNLANRFIPDGVRGKRFLRSLALDPRADYVVGDDEITVRSLLSEDFLPPSTHVDSMDVSGPFIDAAYPSELDALCMHDLHLYLPDDILTKVDRMSMAVSLEVRVPILDHRVAEFGFNIPARYRMRRGTGKYLLKKLLERYLPAEHVHRRKSGFDIPLGLWFRGELRGFLEDALCEEAIRRVGFFDPHVVQGMVRTHMSGARNFEARLWRILVAQVWAERCLQAPALKPGAVPAFAAV